MATDALTDLKPVYLIFGNEPKRLVDAVNRLKERLAAVADLDFNYHTFEGPGSDVDEIIAVANTLPMMSERRLIVVRDIDGMAAGAAKTLAAYAANPADHTCLVLTAEKVSKTSALYKAVDALGGVYEYRAPKRGEYPREVVKLVEQHGRTIDLPAAARLVELVGADLRRLGAEIEKLVAFTNDGGQVPATLTLEQVDALVDHTAKLRVFDLQEALGMRDFGMCLRILASLTEDGEPLPRLQVMLVRYVRELLSARALMDRGERSFGVAKELGIPEWRATKLMRHADRFSVAELSRALRDAAEMDRITKTSPGDPGLVVERWMALVCGAERR